MPLSSSPRDHGAPVASTDRDRDRAALSAFRHLARSQPESMLDLLLAETARFEDPRRALDILDDCGSDIGESLARGASERAKVTCSEIASICAYDNPASLDRLSRSLPGLWLVARHGDIFLSLADALASSSDAPDEAACSAARMAIGWIGAGLSPPAWLALANQGGPAWRAFRDAHAQAARDDPSRAIAPSDMGWLSWKGAARVARASGMTGYGLWGTWPQGLASSSPSITERLEAALGLRELVSEMKLAALSKDTHAVDALSKSKALLGLVISRALDHDTIEPPWSGFLRRALQSLPTLGLAPSDIVCPIFAGYGLPATARNRLVDSSMRTKKAGSARLPNFLAMNRSPALRSLGLDLGSNAAASFSLWHGAILFILPTRTQLPLGYPLPAGPPSGEVLALIEAQELSMVADATRRENGHGGGSVKVRTVRI